MQPIIQVRNLSKRYRIGTRERGYKTFREAIVAGVTAPFCNFAKFRRLTHFSDNGDQSIQNLGLKTQNSSDEIDTIWALREVSFDVMLGEHVHYFLRTQLHLQQFFALIVHRAEGSELRHCIEHVSESRYSIKDG